jgi:gamma-glutamyl hercynylcysteine S-oxide synthase
MNAGFEWQAASSEDKILAGAFLELTGPRARVYNRPFSHPISRENLQGDVMIKKATYALTLILLVLALGACGTNQEATTTDQNAAAQKPAINYGEMVLIPAGEYTIGTKDKNDPSDAKEILNAYPEHKVKLDAFWIDKYEVTGKQYLDFSAASSYIAEGTAEGKTWRTFFSVEKAYFPVTYITWKDAEAYCKGQGLRLPTEEEWEAAARGPNANRFPWGNEWAPEKSNVYEAGFQNPVAVGQFDQDVSPFGVRDMFGNVQEWTSTTYKPYAGNPKAGDAQYTAGYKVLRGMGSHYRGSKLYGLWARTAYQPNFLADFGCRCAKNATPEEAAKAPAGK